MRVEIEDFRGFVEGAVEVRQSGVVLLVGGNGAGKGALVSALDVVAGRAAPGRTGHLAAGSGLVRARFGLSTETAGEISVDHAAAWVEWRFVEGGARGMRARSVAVGNGDGGSGDVVGLVVEEGGEWWVELSAVVEGVRAGVLERVCGGPGEAPADALEEAVEESWLCGLMVPLRRFRDGFVHFRFTSGGADGELAVRDAGARLAEDGGNLGAVLLGLSTGEPRVWAELRRRMAEILPESGSPVTPVRGETFTVAFSQDGLLDDGWEAADVRLGLAEAGTGAERLLMLLAGLLTRREGFVVLEEPETGLHPAAQRAVLDLLRQQSEERSFFVTTHSPVLIDRAWAGPDARVLAVRRRQGLSTVAELDARTAEAVRDAGLRLSDLAGCGRIILVESAEDERVLSAWIPEVLHDPDVGVVLEAHAARLLGAWLDAGEHLAPWRLLYAGAADGLEAGLRKRAEAAPGVHLLRARSLDNLLLDFDVLAEFLDGTTIGWQFTTPPARLAAEARRIADGWRADGGVPPVPDEEWAERWTELVPGTELLGELWRRIIGRPYSRRADAETLALAMRPPDTLLRDVAAFMNE